MPSDVDFGCYVVNCAEELGRGTFGVVYKGQHKTKGYQVAVKKMIIKSNEHGALAMKEIKILSRLEEHPNIMTMEDYFYHDNSFWIVMDFCEEGDLNDYMASNKTNMDERFRLMYECACAVTHMHELPNPIVHRDLKPGNILVKMVNGKATAKVTDLGLSRMVDIKEMVKTAVFATQVGTPGFMAPEQYDEKEYGYRVDIFAMGLVFLSILVYKSGKYLIPEAEEGMKVIPIGQEMSMKAKMNKTMLKVVIIHTGDGDAEKKVKQVIAGMTQYDPKKRPNMRQAMEVLADVAGIEVVKPITPGAAKLKDAVFPSVTAIKANEDEKETELANASGKGFDVLLAALREGLRKRAEDKDEEDILEKLGVMMMLHEALGGKKFEIDDKVVVDTDIDKAKKLQINHGEWVDGMERYLGLEGKIIDTGVGTFRVRFADGKSVIWNAALLKRPGEGTIVRPPFAKARHVESSKRFCQYDLIKVIENKSKFEKLQKEIGVWRDDLVQCANQKGVVVRIDSDGDIVVYLQAGPHAIRFTAHPDALTKIDAPDGPIESGDIVYLKDDEREVERLQKDHGGWNSKMKSALGSIYAVEETGRLPNGNQVAKVEVDGSNWYFNVEVLVLIAKSEEMFKAVLGKGLGDQMALLQRLAADSDTSCCIQ